MLEIKKLRCMHMKCPRGIDKEPYFSWVLESNDENVVQVSYQLQVTDEENRLVWDSKRCVSGQSTYVEYEGEELKSRTKYVWTISIQDNHGNRAEASSEFETAFLHEGDWQARWVKSPFPVIGRQAHLGEQPPAVLFRQRVILNKKVKKARLYATCHGVYQLTINGNRPDNREFAPECTVYRDYLCYQIYDVTENLKPGENIIGMHVGDGWYHGFMTKAEDKAYDPAFAVLTQLEVTYTDGEVDCFGSDKTVKVKESPVRCSDLFAGERYDANLNPYGWEISGFNDKDWSDAIPVAFGYNNLKAQYGQPVRPIVTLPVKQFLISPKGERIIDFGQVIAGRVRIKIDVPKDTQVTIIHTEGLDAEGNFFDNNPSADQRIEYISAGLAQEYEPHFTFQGFRYVMVEGIEDLKGEDIKAVVLCSEKENAGTFSCSNEDVNRLYENTRWSQYANMISIPTDCPQREKAGWTGDIQVYTKTALLNEDVTPFLTRWLENLICEQKDNGSVPFVVPLAGAYIGQYKMYADQFKTPDAVAPAGWGDAAILIPYYMYCLTGNTYILKKQYNSMKHWCDFVIKTAKEEKPEDSELPQDVEQYLWNTGHHFGEHLIPSYSKDGYGESTFEAIRVSTRYVAPIYGFYSVSSMSEIAKILGNTEDEKYYREMADRMRISFHKGVIDEEGNMPADLMGAYAMPLYYGLVPENYKEKFAGNLIRKIEENKGCLDVGFLGMPILQDALCQIGRQDLAYDLLFNEKAPSWLYEVKHGATTIWESWFALDENGAPFVSEIYGMVFCMSLNHYAFGCVDDWMFRNINGINYEEPGFKRILIQPQLDDRLNWAKRTFTSEYGDIVSEWKKEEEAFELYVKIPCNTTAVIILPDGKRYEKGSGEYRFYTTI
ncbi:glycoside hydrolase family 78 protein [Faecalicatena orotica]|uniref:alpha-L-rhamnosidase n=1 Tax=Faecalicatena orotica TaxID=1544 RepID=A0A2Y9BLC2_9FIRM|nr:family 78 glycoside hydrolase catalytic domain [Faecalicatena orotica]PWJ21524.1 alpha-L-rhamnosidase [Faecalicatena orotica]SSA58334.1 alpha-L-rhamnosidase [Faecalicatena orotica]